MALKVEEGNLHSLVLRTTSLRNRTSLQNVRFVIGSVRAAVDYAGPDGTGNSGLDQVYVRPPQELRGRGVVVLILNVDGVESNVVTIKAK
jgi:uncharacterized protein (TIGR03437 family)